MSTVFFEPSRKRGSGGVFPVFKSCFHGVFFSCVLLIAALQQSAFCLDIVSESESSAEERQSDSISTNLPQSNDSAEISALEKMAVTALRRQKLLEASHSLSIIRKDEWAATNKSLADIIAEQTGVQTRRYGGTGSFQSVTVRGVQGDNVLVLLDGIPLNSAMGGAVDLSAINPDRIGEIEVFKGITPAEFGGNSIGGVINLKSRTSAGQNSFNANTAIGAYGYRKFSAEANHPFSDRFQLFGSVSSTFSGNDWPYLDRNKTYANSSDDRIRTVENHAYSSFDARLHPTLELKNGRTLSSGIAYSVSGAEIPAEEGYVNRTAEFKQKLFDFTARLSGDKLQQNHGFLLTPEIAFLQWDNNTFWTSQDESMGPDMGDISTMNNAWIDIGSVFKTFHLSCIADLFFSEFLMGRVSLQGRHSEIETETKSSGYPVSDWPGNSQEISLSGDIDGLIPAGPGSFGITAGGTVKGVRSATDGGVNERLKITVKPSLDIEYPWAAHAGIQWRIENVFNLFVNAARYSNVPGLREKFGLNGTVLPSPGLKEETGTTIEGGARLLKSKTWVEAVVFRTETQNGVVMSSDGRMAKAGNFASTLTTGLETSLRVRPLSFIETEVRATLQKAENRSHYNGYYGNRLPNEPDLSVLARISFGPFKGIEPEYWLDYKSPFFRDPGNVSRVPDDPDKPGMLFHNARIIWKTGRNFDLGLSIRNFSRISLRSEEMIRSYESGYSWILYPSNEWLITAGYSF
ncbi:MAG: TonB-dependent receptor [Fibrobacter sp.]|nr:TonB-dependent receptor [Fibrobacter sp.]